jgi:predicted small lipoprotein YifL
MKNIITFIIVYAMLFNLSACDKKTGKIETTTQDVKPKTITKQEVARIALIEAKQFITNAQSEKGLNLSNIQSTYDKAQSAYDNGNYSEAQKIAVDVRHMVQDLLTK